MKYLYSSVVGINLSSLPLCATDRSSDLREIQHVAQGNYDAQTSVLIQFNVTKTAVLNPMRFIMKRKHVLTF